MAEKKNDIQEKLNTLKQIRKAKYEENKNNGAMIYNKVEFIGEGENTGKELYRVVEKYSIGENKTEIREFFYEFENNKPNLIAVRNDKTSGDIMPTSYPGEEGPQKDAWDAELLDLRQCLDEIEKRDEQLKEIVKELGIDEEDIESLSEIELKQKIEDKEKESQEEKQEENSEDESTKISEEQAEKIGIKGNGMNSAKTNVAIDTKGNTLGKELELEEYESVLVVHSYKKAELENSEGKKGNVIPAPYSLVGRKKDGTLEVIPKTKLEYDRRSNREIVEINDKENVEVKNEESIFKVPNSNKRIAINQNDPYGIPEIYYGKIDKENEGNVMQSVQDERDGTQKKDVEVRALFNSNKGEYQIDKMHDEVESHIKAGCKDLGKEEVDGDISTGHRHAKEELVITPDTILIYKGKEMKISEIAAGSRFKLSVKAFCDLFNEIVRNNGKISQDDILNKIEDQVNNDVTNPQNR